MTIITRKTSNFFNLAIFIISDINLPLSPICLFLTYAVYCVEIKSERTFLSFSERAFDIIFRYTFNKEMGVRLLCRASSFVEHFIFLFDKIILNQEVMY